MDQVNLNVMFHLCHKIFIGTPDGKQLLELLNELDSQTPTFPQTEETMNQHGGPVGWAAFRAGQRHFVKALEAMAVQQQQLTDAELSTKQ
jgi:hypothetical protein